MNSKDIGDVSTAHILTRLLDGGYKVLLPFGENCRYDLAVDLGNKLIRIQCKTGKMINGCVRFNTKSVCYINKKATIRPYNSSEVDAYMIYSPELDKVYLTPVNNKSAMWLRIDEPLSNQSKIRKAIDYEFTGKMPEWLKGTGC